MSTSDLLIPVSDKDLRLALPDEAEALLRRTVRSGFLLCCGFVVLLLLVTFAIRVHGAVLALGEVGVESKVKEIAHPTGGTIAQIMVHDGDHVRRGQALIRLDTNVSGVSASVSGKSVDQLSAQAARLEAEREGLPAIAFPARLRDAHTPQAEAAMTQEVRMFELRRRARLGEDVELVARIRQLEEQIAGFNVQIEAARQQQVLIQPELEGLRRLWKQQLVTINRLNALERTAVDLHASMGSIRSQIAATRAQIAEIKQQRIQLAQAARTQAGTELVEVQQRQMDGQIRSAIATDSLDRSLIRAPADGIVDQLAFTTVGGVVPAGAAILRIVPDRDRLIVEVKIAVDDVDQVAVGRKVVLRFPGFSAPTTPSILGKLTRVSAESVKDERTGRSFFTGAIAVGPTEARQLGELILKPGMPVEAMIQTRSRSLLSYITKPIQDQFARAFREGD